FTYVAFGELWGWLVGWALILELLLAASLVARAWSSYFLATLDGFDISLPTVIVEHSQVGSDLNLVAPALLIVLTLLVATGTKLSASVLSVAVLAKVAVILLVIVVGLAHIDRGNYTPFVPEPQDTGGDGGTLWSALIGVDTSFGVAGVFAATAVIVFGYIGFDLISTAAEDTKEPRHSVPRAMLISIGLVSVLYVAMAVVLVGLRPYLELGTPAPVSDALGAAGVDWAAKIVNLGGLLAFTTVIMVVLIAQSRVLFSMGRDGLLPGVLGRVSRRYSTPTNGAIVAGLAATVVALFPTIGELEQMLVLGALFAFFFCSVGVPLLRLRQPDLERGFRVPGSPFVPLLAAAAIVWLGLNLTGETWIRFAVWMLVGLVFYLAYGRSHSALAGRIGMNALPSGTHGKHSL
ncbi:MAG: APC family permease, partial [Nocardioidaceae bacterium]